MKGAEDDYKIYSLYRTDRLRGGGFIISWVRLSLLSGEEGCKRCEGCFPRVVERCVEGEM